MHKGGEVMFLKRLEIMGFKSFADRISIDFVQGVTAVVGPNGSGKSNITDGIRWVLGEQSVKSLRGAKLEDIIFAGSDTRKPLNVAEVTLTLDNEDQRLPIEFNEISVTRRVYRSGDSDFFINKQACRLKDIVDLFMDSGMGREAFTIISQGKVEEILSSKPEDRRSIFEEAAGVLKYKTRKKKAEAKLEETQENLNRVEDIIHELSKQIEPLGMQASAAKDYLEKKEELERVEAALIVYEIEELHEKWEALLKQLEENKDKELTVTSSLQSDEANIEKMRADTQTIDESIQSLQEVLLLSSKELEKLEGQRELLKERKKNADENCLKLEQMVVQLTEKLSQYEQNIASDHSLLQEISTYVARLQIQLHTKLTALQSFEQNLDERIETLKGDYIELLNKQASIRNEISLIEEQTKQRQSKNKQLDEENEKYVKMRAEIKERKQILIQEYAEFKSKLENHKALLRETEANISHIKQERNDSEGKLYQAYQFLQKTRSRKEMLEEMQEDYAGFYQGVREVLKARNQLQGIEGAVAELISAPAEYEVAIETTLGAAMQHIVVKTEENGREAISYLKRNQYGRATFLPLSVIKGKNVTPEALYGAKQHPAFLGIAANLIQYDKRYETIIQSLLGTVFVTRDLKGANELARLLKYRYRIVTLEGDIVNPGGAMTGGAVKQAKTSLLSRQREIETVTAKLAEMEEKTNSLEERVRNLKQRIHDEENQVIRYRNDWDAMLMQDQERTKKLTQVEAEENRVNDRLAMYDLEIEGIVQDQSKREERIQELEEKLQILAQTLIKYDEEIGALSKKKNEQTSSKEKLQDEITELKVAVAKHQQRQSNQQEKVTRLEKDYHSAQQQIIQTKEDLTFLKQEMTSNSSGEEQLSAMIQMKDTERNRSTELIRLRREQRFTLQETYEKLEQEGKEAKRQQKYLIQLVKEQEIQVNRLDVELDNRLQQLREAYSISFEAAKDKYPMEMPVEDAKRQVKLTKASIDELGTVNLGAIDEYDRISQRYTFLLEQQGDLVEAKETLYQIIGEMDEEMKKRFSHTFTAIKSEFQETFRELFGGGRADLVMTDNADLLATGIDIVAQPPGKKLQNLGLLSGGERALTAIALLFAILRVRPVPFCILDEAEAALDEANVLRFAQYLKNFTANTQFIVITHRKGTMEECDVLYGVTMQESGVSKLVSVRLDEKENVLTE